MSPAGRPAAGCAYLGVRLVRHAARDLADLAGRGFQAVLLPFAGLDLVLAPGATAALVGAAHAAGLEAQLAPWELGLPVASRTALPEPLDPWLEAAAATGARRVLVPAGDDHLPARARAHGLRPTLLVAPERLRPGLAAQLPGDPDLAAVASWPAQGAADDVRRTAQRLRAASGEGRAALWLPLVGLGADQVAELQRAVAAARSEGVDELWAFAYEAGAQLSALASADAEAVWEAASGLLGGARGLSALATEGHRPDLADLDLRPTRELVRLMATEDRVAVDAVAAAGDAIARAVDAAAERLARGGRLVYVGAGSSGRLAAVDASEAGPTFDAAAQVLAIVAGGEHASPAAQEAAEDDADAGAADVAAVGLRPDDVVVALSASGRTPYVLGAARRARADGCLIVAVVCAPGSPLAALADLEIAAVVGAELVTGSTRLKAGTAQKVVLNALSTLTMVRLGRTYGNLMVGVRQANGKLRVRARGTVALATGAADGEVDAAFEAADGDPRVAIVALLTGLDAAAARARLDAAGGAVRPAVTAADAQLV